MLTCSVQLFALLTPFLVNLFSWCIFRNSNQQEKLTWQTFVALLATVIGSVLIIMGGVADNTDTEWYRFFYNFSIDWSTLGLTKWDYLGIALSIMASTCLAGYMILVKSLKTNGSASAVLTDGENMFIFQTCFIALILLIPSVLMEDWTLYSRLSLANWGYFMMFCVFVLLSANLISILCIQKLGATTVGSVLSIRMVSAIIFSAAILHEWLNTAWQVIGSVLVLVSVSVYLYWQQKQMKKKPAEPVKKDEHHELEFVTINDSTEHDHEHTEHDEVNLTGKKEEKPPAPTASALLST
jgi:drug/metabolite transporter (DMT)-like permease